MRIVSFTTVPLDGWSVEIKPDEGDEFTLPAIALESRVVEWDGDDTSREIWHQPIVVYAGMALSIRDLIEELGNRANWWLVSGPSVQKNGPKAWREQLKT